MKPFAIIISVSIVLAGCASPREQASESDRSSNQTGWAESIRGDQHQREAADAQAKATGDERPYPKGWPAGMLPRNRDPRIVESIHPGQTMEDIVKILGAEGWLIKDTRDRFLSSSRSSYLLSRSSRKEPDDWRVLKGSVPVQGEFTEWRYQGFPTTADWIVVYFTQSPQDAEPRVVARGVFRLGDLF